MNKEWVLGQLCEAHEELTRTIKEIEADPKYCEIRLEIAIQHAYSHLNTAWNSRNVAPSLIKQHTDDEFYAWRAFPTDISMGRSDARKI